MSKRSQRHQLNTMMPLGYFLWKCLENERIQITADSNPTAIPRNPQHLIEKLKEGVTTLFLTDGTAKSWIFLQKKPFSIAAIFYHQHLSMLILSTKMKQAQFFTVAKHYLKRKQNPSKQYNTIIYGPHQTLFIKIINAKKMLIDYEKH